jgi:hypothetical protein
LVRRIAVLTALAAAASASAAGVGCPLEIEGTWRLVGAAPNTPALMSFTRDGWANVLGGPSEAGAGDIAAQVGYRLIPPLAPRRIEFDARRGNDVFPPGVSSWEVTGHADDSFTAHPVNKAAGEQNYWTRVQTRRYFLTFAARSAAGGEGAAFIMWTTLDGRATQLDALGSTQQSGGAARFGRIADQIARSFERQGDPAQDVMFRLELNEAEYLRTRALHRQWTRMPARGDDANARAAELIGATVRSVNQCGARIVPPGAAPPRSTGPVPQSAAADLVRAIRNANDRRHLSDRAFPATWKPPALT